MLGPTCLNLLSSCPPSLSEQLRQKTDKLLATIVRTNCNTQFAQAAPELAEFRGATSGLIDGMNDNVLSESFRKAVCFTTYGSYMPFVERFLEKPCKESAVTSLLAPGLPDYIIHSNATSGGRAKVFPRYNCYTDVVPSERGWWSTPDPLERRTRAYVWSYCCDAIHIEDENDGIIKTVYLTPGSPVVVRGSMHLYPEQDGERMGTFIFDHAAPYAATFIKNWLSTLVIHALFALCSRSLKTMVLPFITTFVDMMRHLDTVFDMVIDCIANGTIPDLDGIADVRYYLEINMSPDPERAAELRSLGRPSSQPGWCILAWPSLHSIRTVAGGPLVTCIPSVRWFLGPDVDILDISYACTEGGMIGRPYDMLEINQYKLVDKTIVEFLDLDRGDSISGLVQPWEVELGRRYEVVLTTRYGIWRYRLGDVIEIAGFDPTDGGPIVHFVERRNIVLRFGLVIFREEDVLAAVTYMAASISAQIFGWTAAMDDRLAPVTIGFFVEIADDQPEVCTADLARATGYVLDKLSELNVYVADAVECAKFRKPTVRIVRPGTFCHFLQLKMDEGLRNISQAKVPVVLPKPEYVAWFSERVIREL